MHNRIVSFSTDLDIEAFDKALNGRKLQAEGLEFKLADASGVDVERCLEFLEAVNPTIPLKFMAENNHLKPFSVSFTVNLAQAVPPQADWLMGDVLADLADVKCEISPVLSFLGGFTDEHIGATRLKVVDDIVVLEVCVAHEGTNQEEADAAEELLDTFALGPRIEV